MARRGRGRSELDPRARENRFQRTPETFHPQSGTLSVLPNAEKLMFVASMDTLIKSLVLTISQADPPSEAPQTQVYIKFKFANNLEIKFPSRDIKDGLNSYLIPRALGRLEIGTEVYISIDKTLDVTYGFDIRG